MPTLAQSFPRLIEHPAVFVDALYVHKKPSEGGNACQEVYDFLTTFEDRSKHSYFFEVTASSDEPSSRWKSACISCTTLTAPCML